MEIVGSIAGLSAAACWAFASVLYTRVSIGAGAMTTFKNCLASVLLLVALFGLSVWRGEQLFQASAAEWWILGISGIIGLCLADIAYFRSLQILGPRQGLTLTLLTPPATALLGRMWLGEELSLQVWVAILVTVAGIAVAVREQATDEAPQLRPGSRRWGIICALLGIGCMAVGAVLLRQGSHDVGTVEATFIRLFVPSVFGVFCSFCLGQLQEIRELFRSRQGTSELTSATFLGTGLGVWLMVVAYKYCLVGIAATSTSTAPLFIIPIVWYFLGQRVSKAAICGAAVAFVGVCGLLLGGN